jgi:alkanesulfonate monooxygenase SsuD/methylene tetrahydromethanopterin reductase-like flavin-dependent oxidoreductase (luciferase family)
VSTTKPGTGFVPAGRSGAQRPSSSPHPPILIGRAGESKSPRLVARYGDACNLPDMPLPTG